VVPVVEEDKFYVGIDLGDKKSNYCFLSPEGKVVEEGAMATTQTQIDAYFSEIPRCRIAVEVGTHSPWVSALLESYGHEVFVANPRPAALSH
jgi:transposase